MPTPQQTAQIIAKSAQGLTVREIGDMTGLHYSTVNKCQQKADVRARIEKETEAIVNQGLMVSRKAIIRMAAEGLRQFKQDKPDKDLLKLSLDASKTVLAVAGLTGQPSTIINAMIQINQAPEAEQAVNLLGEFLASNMASVNKLTQCDKESVKDLTRGENTNCVKEMAGNALSRTSAPIDITAESRPLPAPVEETPDRPVDNSPDHPSQDPPTSR